MNKRLTLSLLLIVLVFGRVAALELTEGKIRLQLQENLGRFTAAYLPDIRKKDYTSFFVDQDPRTSFLSLLIDNRVYRMGESLDFRQSLQRDAEGASFIWQSTSMKVTEAFAFVRSPSSRLSDGFSITITLENLSEQSLNVGVRYIFDTMLGERFGTHFTLADGTAIRSETEYRTSMPDYWLSPDSSSQDSGFQGMLRGDGITTPDRVIFANWKRLNDSSWDYQVNTNRNFNLLPYSINDSAVAMYYAQKPLVPAAKRTIVMVFGAYSDNGFSLAKKEGELTELFQTNVTNSAFADESLDLKADLIQIKDLITQIDRYLASGEDLSDEDFQILEQILAALENKKQQYGP